MTIKLLHNNPHVRNICLSAFSGCAEFTIQDGFDVLPDGLYANDPPLNKVKKVNYRSVTHGLRKFLQTVKDMVEEYNAQQGGPGVQKGEDLFDLFAGNSTLQQNRIMRYQF